MVILDAVAKKKKIVFPGNRTAAGRPVGFVITD
jgi:hypothetical protein